MSEVDDAWRDLYAAQTEFYGTPRTITRGNVTRPAIVAMGQRALDMQATGDLTTCDGSASVLRADFLALGITYRSDFVVDGVTYLAEKIEQEAGAPVTIYFTKAYG